MFIRLLGLASDTYMIQEQVWEAAKGELAKICAGSRDLPLCIRVLNSFEETNIKYKYVSDFFLYLQESKEEDFCTEERGVIYVSTIHKSKGREFDCVVLYLKDYKLRSEEEKRTLYVGMTRARERLEIHYNADFPGMEEIWDTG